MTTTKILATTVCMLASGAALADDPLPRGKPEEVGLSSERLGRIGSVLKADIEAGRIPGAVIAIARRGKEHVRNHFLTPRYLRDYLRIFTELLGE